MNSKFFENFKNQKYAGCAADAGYQVNHFSRSSSFCTVSCPTCKCQVFIPKVPALQFEGLNSVSIFTLNNVSVVLLTTLLGILLFKERLSAKNWTGVLLAALSIILVGFF